MSSHNKSLIIDVGMHTGKDTEFYLRKGFRVVGIEANPAFVEAMRHQFAAFIETGDLTIVPYAIAKRPGAVSFFTFQGHDDWSTIDEKRAKIYASRGFRETVQRVEAVTLSEILRAHGIPYYLKIDIEGLDIVCLRQLLEFSKRPKFVSIEAPTDNFGECIDVVSHLNVLGYRQFKVVNQQLHYKHRCPDPPREGRFIDMRFDTLMSGPFGEEAPGDWIDAGKLFAILRRLVSRTKWLGKEGMFPALRGPYNFVCAMLGLEPLAWYDIHASLN
jgi:FkbM family methyltransferase